jgi:hypothetical protein
MAPIMKRACPCLLLLALIAGCDGERLVGSWKGTLDGQPHELRFTGSGRMWRSSDLIGGRSGWTSWRATEDVGNKVWVVAGGRKLQITFEARDEILIYDKESDLRIDMQRTNVETEEEKDTRSYATAYLLVILAVAFGLVAVCRPSRREGA